MTILGSTTTTSQPSRKDPAHNHQARQPTFGTTNPWQRRDGLPPAIYQRQQPREVSNEQNRRLERNHQTYQSRPPYGGSNIVTNSSTPRNFPSTRNARIDLPCSSRTLTDMMDTENTRNNRTCDMDCNTNFEDQRNDPGWKVVKGRNQRSKF